jgi:hypothetical protein
MLTALLAGAAFVAGLTGAWSPCGFSMVSTLGEHARGRAATLAACCAFVPGAVVGGVATFGALAAAGSLLGGGDVALVAAAAIAGVAALAEAAGVRIAPQIRRQVPEHWRRTWPLPLAAAGYGVLLGLGFTTFVLTFAVPALAGVALAVGDVGTGVLIGIAFAAGRALPVVALAPVAQRPFGLRATELMAERPAILRGFRAADALALAACAVALGAESAEAAVRDDGRRAGPTHPVTTASLPTTAGVSAAGILGVATAASTTARSPLARSAATRAWIDGARDPSAAGGALAFMRPDGQAILYAPGTQTQFPADRVAIGGRLVAVVAGGEVRVADRATGVQRLALPAPGADAVAVADRWVAIRRRMGGRDAIQAAAVPAPPPGAVEQAASEGAGRPTLRTVARAREPQQLGRPALAGDRLVFHVTGRRTSRIDEVNLATGARRALRRGGMRRLLTNPSLSSGRLLYVETTPYHQALVLGPRIARRGRTLLRIAPAIEADRGYATPHGPHRPGARRPRRPPREGPPGTTTTLWTTALAPDAAYVTRLRARHGRTRAALLRVALRPGGRAGAR